MTFAGEEAKENDKFIWLIIINIYLFCYLCKDVQSTAMKIQNKKNTT